MEVQLEPVDSFSAVRSSTPGLGQAVASSSLFPSFSEPHRPSGVPWLDSSMRFSDPVAPSMPEQGVASPTRLGAAFGLGVPCPAPNPPKPGIPMSSDGNVEAQGLMCQLVHAVTLLSEQKTGLKSDKPKVTCRDAASLKHELDRFKRYMQEMHSPCGAKWIRAARIVAEDRAQEILKDVIVQTFGSEVMYSECLERDAANAAWESLWQLYERRLRVAAGLEPQDEMKDVLAEYAALKVESNTPASLSAFIDEYCRLRTLMIEKHLITQDDVGTLRETQDFLHKLKTHDVYKYLHDLEYKPKQVDSFNEDERPWTVIGRCRQWLQSRLPGTNTAKDPKNILDQFSALQDKTKKQQQTIAAQKKQLKDLQVDTFQGFGDQGQRWRAAQDFNNPKGSKGTEGKGKGFKGSKDGGGKGTDKGFGKSFGKGDSKGSECSRCHGHHPELEVCANQTASNDPAVRVGELVSSGIKRSYRHPGAFKDCQGSGHLDRHHRNTAGADVNAPKAWGASSKGQTGKGQKGKAKGEGKKGDRRLDFSDDHTQSQDTRTHTQRLLDSLAVFFSPGPSSHTSSNLEFGNCSKETERNSFTCLRTGRRFREFRNQVYHRSCCVCFFFLFTLGILLASLGISMCLDPALRAEATAHVETMRVRSKFATLVLPQGYHCRGYVWVGKARVDTLFDTGATRNAVSKDFLKALVECEETSQAVLGIDDIQPIEATGLSRSTKITIRQVAWIRLSFWEDKGSHTVAEVLGFCVTPNSSEDLLIGKPSLDHLGFVSDKFSIELRVCGVRFPSILPSQVSKGESDDGKYLRLGEHVHLQADENSSRLVELFGKLPAHECWLLPGPDLPEGVFLSEGPCVQRGQRVIGELTSLADCHLGPSSRVAELRPLTHEDTTLLTKVREAGRLRQERFEVLQACHTEANYRLLQETKPRLVDKFLATSYKTRGKKERQEELFPDLVKEADARRAHMTSGITHPDQEAPEYKEACKEVAKKNLGSQLTPSQVARFLTKVVAAFSGVLWMDGCHAPRVEGFEVDIKLKTGAVPKIQQPFPLSRFDQLRLELHEDEEVALGKARWGSLGEYSDGAVLLLLWINLTKVC